RQVDGGGFGLSVARVSLLADRCGRAEPALLGGTDGRGLVSPHLPGGDARLDWTNGAVQGRRGRNRTGDAGADCAARAIRLLCGPAEGAPAAPSRPAPRPFRGSRSAALRGGS